MNKFKVMHTNIQSINGRKNSLLASANSLDIDVISINETNMKGNTNLSLEGYLSFSRNRQQGNMGGIATCIKDIHANNTLKTAEGKKCEFIVTRHGQFHPPIKTKPENRPRTTNVIKEGSETSLIIKR